MQHIVKDRLKDLKLETVTGEIKIKLRSEIPQGAGLGSSASFAATVSGSII